MHSSTCPAQSKQMIAECQRGLRFLHTGVHVPGSAFPPLERRAFMTSDRPPTPVASTPGGSL